MEKGVRPDVLVMTATPIPRTLALTFYGDLDQSKIDELPPGRTPVETRVFGDTQRKKAHEAARRELASGRQVYVVYPLVEESEKTDLADATSGAEELRRILAPHPVALLHGQMKAEEKEAVMARFRSGETRVLVATTVIEVGVDVPNATVMIVEHAERFGLSQLHQLRGRVGRGGARSQCLLVAHFARAGDEARERLRTMVRTQDGFEIARADLRIRGPGRDAGDPAGRATHLRRGGPVSRRGHPRRGTGRRLPPGRGGPRAGAPRACSHLRGPGALGGAAVARPGGVSEGAPEPRRWYHCEMPSCSLCENVQPAGDACDVCGHPFPASDRIDVSVEPLADMEATLLPITKAGREGPVLEGLETTSTGPVTVVATPLEGLEPTTAEGIPVLESPGGASGRGLPILPDAWLSRGGILCALRDAAAPGRGGRGGRAGGRALPGLRHPRPRRVLPRLWRQAVPLTGRGALAKESGRRQIEPPVAMNASAQPSFSAWFRCADGCEFRAPLTEVVYRCPRCQGLLEVEHDLDALRRRSAADWKTLFEGRFRGGPWPFGSGVWGKKEWVYPQLAPENVVSMYEGGHRCSGSSATAATSDCGTSG